VTLQNHAFVVRGPDSLKFFRVVNANMITPKKLAEEASDILDIVD
jgi:hypothetical protein